MKRKERMELVVVGTCFVVSKWSFVKLRERFRCRKFDCVSSIFSCYTGTTLAEQSSKDEFSFREAR